MREMEVTAIKRSKVGKSDSKQLRKAGKIPAVVYGLEEDSLSVALDRVELEKLFRESKSKNTIFTLNFDDNTTEHVITYHIDRDPLSLKMTHVDFLRVDDNAEIKVIVPLEFVGIAPGTKAGGVLIKKRDNLEIKCVAKKIPHHITINVSELGLGDFIRVSDIDTKGEFKILTLGDDTVALVETPKNIEEEVAAAAAPADSKTASTPASKETKKG